MSSWHWSHSSLHAPLTLPDCLPAGDHLGGGAGLGSDANNKFSCHNVEPLAAPAWENTEIPRRGNITIILCCSTMIIILQQLLFFLSRLSHSNGDQVKLGAHLGILRKHQNCRQHSPVSGLRLSRAFKCKSY